MRLRPGLLGALLAALLIATPALTYAQPRVAVGVRVAAPRRAVVVATYARPYYRGYYYRPYIYDPFWYPGPYWYPSFYAYQRPYYFDGGAALRLQVTPRQTEVFIDGYYAGTVDDFDGFFQRLNIDPGEHDLELYLAGHRTVQQKVYLQPGRTFRVRHTMEPLRPGDPEPVRPANTASPNPPAPRQAPGVPGRPSPPDRRERPGPAPITDYGTLALRVQPADAEVLIDGEKWTGSGDERLDVQLAAGVHHLEIRKDGYRVYSTDVTIRGGETSTLNVALRRN